MWVRDKSGVTQVFNYKIMYVPLATYLRATGAFEFSFAESIKTSEFVRFDGFDVCRMDENDNSLRPDDEYIRALSLGNNYLVSCSPKSHYWNQRRLIINWTFRKNFSGVWNKYFKKSW